ncbi:MAG: hypothetical protein GC191_02385 [Azospirillum sp.]|nr:hypothetical protein [Azospirillum sp.]
MNSTTPYVPASTERSLVVTAEEFNLWCALNAKPFNLVQHSWPDGRVEWDIEVFPGSDRSDILYGSGQEDEAMAVIAAFAFLAGVEWAKDFDGIGRLDREAALAGSDG